jgi:3'(2'), 5'-bisphosphate nucleotidase
MTNQTTERSAWARAAIEAVRSASSLVLEVYASDFVVERKDDASPVTEADRRAEAAIVDVLARMAPGLPIVAEEAFGAGQAPPVADRFWLVDPLDGTREFVSRNGEFTVNVALIEDSRPILGVIAAPVLGRTWVGVEGDGAWTFDAAGRRAIRCRRVPPEGATVIASRSHGDAQALQAYLVGRKVATMRNAGSSLKLCLVAQGAADLYPRFGRTMEWDIAAGHAIVAAAGGHVVDLDGRPLRYGKDGFENPNFVAHGLPSGDEPVA